MWHTPKGERTLKGAEAALFREALGTLVDQIRIDDEEFWQSSISLFDSLSHQQKLAVLALVGAGLLRESQPALKLTATLEATVAVIYEMIRTSVEIEIDHSRDLGVSTIWRELVLYACQELKIEELIEPNSPDLDEWDVLIDCLVGEILWDEDWLEVDHYLDADPNSSRGVKKMMGIDKDYYIAVPPDPTSKEVEGILATLHGLISEE
jgi:hypothetical protein